MKIIIPGEAMGKQRPRMDTRTGRAYTPAKTVQYENWVKQCYCSTKNRRYLNGAIKADIKVYKSIPKSTSKKKRNKMIDGLIRPTKKPDVDNICKIILDSLNGLAYDDDKQIVECSIEKWYGERPRIELILEEVQGCLNE